MTPDEPEDDECASQPERRFNLVAGEKMLEGRAQVLLFVRQAFEPARLVGVGQLALGGLRELEEEVRVPIAERLRVGRIVESLDRIFANCFQHPVAIFSATEEALVNE